MRPLALMLGAAAAAGQRSNVLCKLGAAPCLPTSPLSLSQSQPLTAAMWADLIADDLRPEFAGPSPYAQKQAITPNIVRRSSAASSLPCSPVRLTTRCCCRCRTGQARGVRRRRDLREQLLPAGGVRPEQEQLHDRAPPAPQQRDGHGHGPVLPRLRHRPQRPARRQLDNLPAALSGERVADARGRQDLPPQRPATLRPAFQLVRRLALLRLHLYASQRVLPPCIILSITHQHGAAQTS